MPPGACLAPPLQSMCKSEQQERGAFGDYFSNAEVTDLPPRLRSLVEDNRVGGEDAPLQEGRWRRPAQGGLGLGVGRRGWDALSPRLPRPLLPSSSSPTHSQTDQLHAALPLCTHTNMHYAYT